MLRPKETYQPESDIYPQSSQFDLKMLTGALSEELFSYPPYTAEQNYEQSIRICGLLTEIKDEAEQMNATFSSGIQVIKAIRNDTFQFKSGSAIHILYDEFCEQTQALALGNWRLIKNGYNKLPELLRRTLTDKDKEDLVQIGFQGLLSAAERFDPHYLIKRGKSAEPIKFSSYAVDVIKGFMLNSRPQVMEASVTLHNLHSYREYCMMQEYLQKVLGYEQVDSDDIVSAILVMNHKKHVERELEKSGVVIDEKVKRNPNRFKPSREEIEEYKSVHLVNTPQHGDTRYRTEYMYFVQLQQAIRYPASFDDSFVLFLAHEEGSMDDVDFPLSDAYVSDTTLDPAKVYERAEIREVIRQAISRLYPKKYGDMLYYYIYGVNEQDERPTIEDVAQRFGVSVYTATAAINKAKDDLRMPLKQQGLDICDVFDE